MEIKILGPHAPLRIILHQQDGWRPDRQFDQGSLADDLVDRIQADGNEAHVLGDMFEPYWSNGGFEPFDAGEANPFVGMTDAPCIAEHAIIRGEDGRQSIQPGDRVWWYPDYAVRNPLDVLLDRGFVDFQYGFTAEEGVSC